LGDIRDQAQYQVYKDNVDPNIAAAGGKYLVRNGDARMLEGILPASFTVVFEPPSRPAALAWYQSDEYAQIKELRKGAAQVTIYIVDGLG
jgi:uncharacterized protein (DUF1330 family)